MKTSVEPKDSPKKLASEAIKMLCRNTRELNIEQFDVVVYNLLESLEEQCSKSTGVWEERAATLRVLAKRWSKAMHAC